MVTFLAICAHLALNVWAGWAFLGFLRHNRNWAESAVAYLLCGMYLETLLIAFMLFAGMSLKTSVFVFILIALVLTVLSWRKRGAAIPEFSFEKPKWYEWLLTVSIAEKIFFGLWQMTKTPLFFSDAMTHWSGRARTLLGSVNWSFNHELATFLGYTGKKHYPLETPVWRAVTAVFNGGWNDVVGRVDGLFFFIAAVVSVWLIVWRFSGKRWLAAAAAFILSSLPLQAWHIAAGYSDIAVEAFVLASLAALLRKEWFLAGILAAGTAWSKNDGLVLFVPGLMVMAVLLQPSCRGYGGSECLKGSRWKKILWFLAGVATLTPWFVFKYAYSLGLAPDDQELSFHWDAPVHFWEKVIIGKPHGIFWIFIFLLIFINTKRICGDGAGRALLGFFLTSLFAIAFVYFFTDAYAFLMNEMTVHRSMMQLYGVALITAVYGIWLGVRDHPLSGNHLFNVHTPE